MQVDHIDLKRDRVSRCKPHMIITQSVSVVLFSKDESIEMSHMELCKETFSKKPWQFHHVTELNTISSPSHRVHTRQEYYELDPQLPLFSKQAIHYGAEIIRINIFTLNHQDMLEFYRKLVRVEPIHVRKDFSYFEFTLKNAIRVQLGLKGASNLMPYPTQRAQLKLKTKRPPVSMPNQLIRKNIYEVTDPDSNSLVVDCSDYNQSKPDGEKVTNEKDADCDKLEHSRLVKISHQKPDIIPDESNLSPKVLHAVNPSPNPLKLVVNSRIRAPMEPRQNGDGSPCPSRSRESHHVATPIMATF